MKIAVWGAGDVGQRTAYRFATLDFVSEIAWINRTLANVEGRRIDLDQGLAFAPACRSVVSAAQKEAGQVLADTSLLILTHGAALEAGQKREELYPKNAEVFRSSVLPALAGFNGIVIVVSNPVELLCRLLVKEGSMSPDRVIGLGTVVETARMQSFLRDYLVGTNSARDIHAYAIGTHDEHFVPVIPDQFFPGDKLSAKVLEAVRKRVQRAVAIAAKRVKIDEISTLHPIVEGLVTVSRAIANDTHSILTISALDPEDPDELFYSLPCAVGRGGMVKRYPEILDHANLRAELQVGIGAMRKTLKGS